MGRVGAKLKKTRYKEKCARQLKIKFDVQSFTGWLSRQIVL
jgi:hypothetical protein